MLIDEVHTKRLVVSRTRTNTRPHGGNRPLISRPLDFRHEQHIGLDNLGGGANEHSTGMVTSHSMQAGLNQTGNDLYPLTKVSAEILLVKIPENILNAPQSGPALVHIIYTQINP